MEPIGDAKAMRVIRLLRQGPARCEASVAQDQLLLTNGVGTVQAPKDLLQQLVADGHLVMRNGLIALAPSSAWSGTRRRNVRELAIVDVELDGTRRAVLANLSESPLAQLVRIRARDGTPFLAPAEFEAGEQLRADYTFSHIMPRLGANWEAPIASGRRAAGRQSDLTDGALAARQRVERALSAVGPELSGVLVDVCCFLKGLETVERERGWPVRSAKIVLKTALAALARHYRPSAGAERRSTVMHWGADDFRPSLL